MGGGHQAWAGQTPVAGGLSGFVQHIARANFRVLGITPEHVLSLATLPLHHRDPFDRMLIAQAKSEGMHLLTVDPEFGKYEVPLAGV